MFEKKLLSLNKKLNAPKNYLVKRLFEYKTILSLKNDLKK